MKHFITIGVIILLAAHLPAAEQGTLLNKETVRHEITVFRNDRLSPGGRVAAEVVRRFAEKSTDVILTITPKRAPYLSDMNISTEDRSLLLAAYVVGNVDLQLVRNEKKDDPYSGILEVIETYRQMQKKDPTLSLPEIENFIELEKRGELKKYVTSP